MNTTIRIAAFAVMIAASIMAQSIVDRNGRKVFIRGMGWSPWHATHGWNRTPESEQEDTLLLKELHVNTLRMWGPSTSSREWFVTNGFYLIPQLSMVKAPRSVYGDLSASRSTIFADAGVRATNRANGSAAVRAHMSNRYVIAMNLGNEYTTVGQNAKKQYVYAGFDPVTIAAYQKYLSARFGNVERLNAAFGASFTRFDDVMPPEEAAKTTRSYEWFTFLRSSFGAFMRAAHDGVRSEDQTIPVTYARLLSRWDAACEDADLSFLDLQGENIYYSWGKNWGDYCVRLARLIGPCRPALITETGVDTLNNSPKKAARMYRQMLWLAVMHPEIVGICPFSFCDEWYKSGDPKKQDPDKEEHWGIVTATREKKAVFDAVKETYGIFKGMDDFLVERTAPPVILISDQCVDDRIGSASRYAPLAKELYRRGVSFRMVSLFDPSAWVAKCGTLALIDSILPSDPDGTSAAFDALLAFMKDGGEIYYFSDTPWKAVYPLAKIPAVLATARDGEKVAYGKGSITFHHGETDVPRCIQRLNLPRNELFAADAEGVYWRVLHAPAMTAVILVNTRDTPISLLPFRTTGAPTLAAADGAVLVRNSDHWQLAGLETFAVLQIQ